MRTDLVILALHVAANTVWVGALLAAVVVARANGAGSEHAKLGRAVYSRLAAPAFILSLVLGAVRLSMDWQYYMATTHFMHAKLALAFVAIVAHHWIGARLRRLSGQNAGPDRLLALLALVFGISCLGAVAFAVVKPF